jgi:RimJ/RimL family protein N-acetyltransferase
MYLGEKIRLRALEPADVPLLYDRMNDRDVTENITVRYPMSVADEERFVAGAQISYQQALFAVDALDDGQLIGTTGLRGATPENRTASLGITINNKTRWDQGLGTDIMRTVCRFGFEEMDLARIELWVLADNDRARRVYEKVGFVYEGTARQRSYKGGRRLDEQLYGLLRGELR